MKKRSLLLGIFLLAGSILPAFAADNYSLWTSAGVRKDFHNWKFELNEEFRFTNNVSNLARYFTEMSAGYDVTKWLNMAVGYRFTQDRDKHNDWRTLHRFIADAELSKDVKRVELSYRLRYTNEDDFNAGGNDASSYLRQRAEVEYHISNSRFDPYLSGELYCLLPDGKSGEFRKAWYTLGVKFSLNDANRFNLFIRLEQEMNVSNPDLGLITGISYSYRF